MLGMRSISLVMPCRNEAAHLTGLIRSIPAFVDEIIVVSNASRDGTWPLLCRLAAAEPRLKTLRDDRTRHGVGYGYAHMTGIRAATGDLIVCMDADGTYPVGDLPRIMRIMDERGLRFASCTRYPDPTIPWMLRAGVAALNLEIRLLDGLRLTDSLSGMWVFHRGCRDLLGLNAGDWNLSPQIKINARRALGGRFGEIRIRQNARHGTTKQHYWATGFSHARWILRDAISAHRAIRRFVDIDGSYWNLVPWRQPDRRR